MVFNIESLRFRTRIVLGFCFILVISIVSSVISIIQVNSIGKKSDLIYEHPFQVSNAVRDINTYVNSMHVHLNRLIAEDSKENIDSLSKQFEDYKKKFDKSFSIISSKYLGCESSVKEAKKAFNTSYLLALKAIDLKKKGQNIKSHIVVTFNFTLSKKDLLQKNKILADFAENKANSLYNRIKEKRNKSIQHLILLIIALFALSIFIVVYLSKNISTPIIKFISKSRNIIENESDSDINIKNLSEENILELVDKELSRIYKENKSILKATMENSHAGIAIADAPSGKIRYVNRVGKLIRNNSKKGIQEALNNYSSINDWDILHMDGNPCSYEELPHIRAIKEGKNISKELIIKFENKEERFIWANAAPIINESKEITAGIVIFLDITKQKQTLKDLRIQNKKFSILNEEYKKQNQELELAKQKAVEINRLKSSFMATMSHELRTPLNTVIGLSELINSDMENSEIIEMVELINKNGNQLLDIIESILKLTLLQAGEYKIKEEIFSVTELCSELQYYFKSELVARKKEHIETLFCNNCSCSDIKINTDKSKLTELLKHILINAIKFTEKGIIEYSHSVINNDIIFSVRDTGTGINEKLLDVIFEKFRQADNSNTRKFGGIGLGLATCKEISNILNGDIKVESKKNIGTTFHFRLKNVVV